jgi:hypothetical protein
VVGLGHEVVPGEPDDSFHDQHRVAVAVATESVDGHDARMFDPTTDQRFGDDRADCLSRGGLRAEDFDRDFAVEAALSGGVDAPEPTLAEERTEDQLGSAQLVLGHRIS